MLMKNFNDEYVVICKMFTVSDIINKWKINLLYRKKCAFAGSWNLRIPIFYHCRFSILRIMYIYLLV